MHNQSLNQTVISSTKLIKSPQDAAIPSVMLYHFAMSIKFWMIFYNYADNVCYLSTIILHVSLHPAVSEIIFIGYYRKMHQQKEFCKKKHYNKKA